MNPQRLGHLGSLAFTISANGFADGPAQALREHLVRGGAARVTTIFHPLEPEDGHVHVVTVHEHGESEVVRRLWAPSHPPWTYPLDLLVPPVIPTSDVWFGFNALACARGLAERQLGRTRAVVYWCVDYVDVRFGEGLRTRVFETLDGICCRRSELRVELTDAACDARTGRHAGKALAQTRVVPMGAWLDRVPVTTPASFRARTIVYLGHLVERQGVDTLIRAVALLRARGTDANAAIIGRGPLASELRSLTERLGVSHVVQFHGFVKDHRDVERLLAESSVAVAPYVESRDSFTRYADPGKLKAYLAAGLPIVTTRVAPNAEELATAGAATLVADDPQAIATSIDELLGSADLWASRRAAALDLAREYDWPQLLDGVLGALGIER